ncbi:hypothetical protein ACS0TY_029172 [Phlomoides rotata]
MPNRPSVLSTRKRSTPHSPPPSRCLVYSGVLKFRISDLGGALRAEVDENGVRHVLMCRMILVNTETIPPASKQLQPSSTDFDSRIDNPLEPTKYIVWTAYMNTHIFPAYIISFTLPGNHSINSTLSLCKPF